MNPVLRSLEKEFLRAKKSTFSLDEILQIISSQENKDAPLSEIGVLLDPRTRIVTSESRSSRLCKREFQLLHYMMKAPRKVLDRTDIIDDVWKDVVVDERTLDVHINKIREKIGKDKIHTVKGVGYAFGVPQ